MVTAGAPGDGHTFCTSGIEPQEYLLNDKVLMDSYNYLNLLGGPGAVWQQVDLDSNNAIGRGTEVSSY